MTMPLRVNFRQILRSSFLAAALLLFSVFAVLGMPASAFSQEVRVQGVVHDASGAVVSGAEVELHSGTYSQKTTTSATGAFAFDNVPGTSGTVAVIAATFQQAQQSWNAVSGAVQLEFTLKLASVSQQVVVTAARTPMPIGETPISNIELTKADLQATPALTLDDMLRQVPGFSLFRRTSSRTANPTTLGVSLRGLGANGASRVLVLEDGIPLNDPFGSWVYWDRVPTAAVSSIEVSQEGASSLYGSEALGGVIQFFTRQAQPAGISLETSYGNQNTKVASLSAGGALGGWQSVFSGEAFQSDGYYLVPKPYRGSVDTKAASQHGAADLTIGHKIGSSGDVFARGSYFDDSRNNGTIGQTNSIRLVQGALGADLTADSLGHLQVRAYGNFETYHQKFYSVALDQNSQALTDAQTVPAQGIGFSAVWSRGVGKRQTLLAGVDDHEELGHSNEQIFSSFTGKNTKDTFTGGHQRTTGVFGEDLIQLSPSVILGASARFDHWRNFDAFLVTRSLIPLAPVEAAPFASRSYNAFDPRLNLVYRQNSHASWSASVYRAFRSPTLNELYRGFRQANNVTHANSNLSAERLTGGEAGVALQGLNKRVQVRGTFFFNEIVNPISNVSCEVTPKPAACPAPTPNALDFVRANLGRTSAPGFEIDWLGQISSRFQLTGGYQYVDATIISAPGQPSLENQWVAQVPHNSLTFQGRYTDPSTLSFSLEGRLIGRQLDTNFFPMGSYFVLDAMASRNVTHGLEAFAAVENLFNEQYVSTAATSLSPPQIGLPIAARFGLRYNFPSHQ